MKKLLSFALTLCILLSAVVPSAVFAEDEASEYLYEIIDGGAVITGYTGEGGDIVVPRELGGYPVVSIGYQAFATNNMIHTVTISYGVKTIESRAFEQCHGLTDITIPKTVQTIGSYVFSSNTMMTEITIPESVVTMGEGLFANCPQMQSIYCEAAAMPEGWSPSWYDNCKAKIYFGGIEYNKPDYHFSIENGEVTITEYIGEDIHVVIPETINFYPVVRIGSKAFAGNQSIETVVIPDTVKYIDRLAFESCYKLRCVIIPDSVRSIGGEAFERCYALSEISLPLSVTSIDGWAFADAVKLKTVYCEALSLPAGWHEEWLIHCDAEVVWGACMHVNTEKSQFFSEATCTTAGKSYLQCDACGRPCSVVDIVPALEHSADGTGTCVVCGVKVEYTYIVCEDKYGKYCHIDQYLGTFSYLVLPSEICGYPVRAIEGEFIQNKDLVETVIIPEGVENIYGSAFAQCQNLQTVVFPDSITKINVRAFSGCSSLREITLPASVEYVGEAAFENCGSLTDIYVESGAFQSSWSAYWLRGCNANVWVEGVLQPKSEFFYTVSDGKATIVGYNGNGGDVVVPSEIGGYPVVSIGYRAFENIETIETLILSDGIVSIGDEAFIDCRNLHSVIIPDSVRSIGQSAFSRCDALIELTIPASVSLIYGRAFHHTTSLKNIYCEVAQKPDGWSDEWLESCDAEISWGACMHRDTPKSEFFLAPTCTEIGKSYLQCDTCGRASSIVTLFPANGHTPDANKYCTVCGVHTEYLYDLYDREDGKYCVIKKYLGTDAHVVIPSEICGYPVRELDIQTIAYNDTVLSITIPDGVVTICDSAFVHNRNLQSVVIPDSVTYIGSGAFSDCFALPSITIPASVAYIGDGAFENCSSLTDIYCEADALPSEWNEYWMNGCDAIVWFDGKLYQKPEFLYRIDGDSIIIIGYDGEGGHVVIPSEIDGYPVSAIGYRAFGDNTTIESIEISEGIGEIRLQAFYRCSALKSVVIPSSVVIIGESAFDHCELLTDVTISEGVNAIKMRAFFACFSLSAITIPLSVETIGMDVFAGCSELNDIFCKASSLPDGWDTYWLNSCDATVWFDGVEYQKPKYYYYIQDGAVVITKYIGKEDYVEIPSEIEGYPVKHIAADAFSYQSTIHTIIIPHGIESIGEGAFRSCGTISHIDIPDSVKVIETGAFAFCQELLMVTLPATIETIDAYAFEYCYNLISIYCASDSQPLGWSNNWRGNCFANVIWGNVPQNGTNLAYGKPYELSEQFRQNPESGEYDENSPVAYPDDGFELTDGYTPTYADAFDTKDCWTAFRHQTPAQQERDYAYIRLDLEKEYLLNGVALTVLKQTSAEINIPYRMECLVSEDGKTWKSAGVVNVFEELDCYDDDNVHTLTLAISAKARYVELRITSFDWALPGEVQVFGGEVPPFVYGDVSGDGKINGTDVTRLLRYIANRDPFTGESTVEIGDGADCNGDGKINGTDVTRLLRYIANRDPFTGESSVPLG